MGSRWRYLLLMLAAIVAAFAAYQPALVSGFFWDDDIFITQNPQMHSLSGLAQIWFQPSSSPHYYPLLLTVFWVLNRFFGDWAAGYHFVNVLLHVANAGLLFALGRRLGLRFAWLGAFLFLLHPINVQSVAWITEMKNTLSTLFIVAGCLVWTAGPGKEAPRLAGPRWFAVAILFAAAMLTKSTSVIMLLALVMIDWMLGRNIKQRAYWVALAPLAVAGLTFALFSIWFERAIEVVGYLPMPSWWQRIGLASWSLFFYLGKLLWPVSLAPVYAMPEVDFGWVVFWSACAGLLLAAAFLWGRHRSWRPFASLVLYAAFLFPIPFLGIAFTRSYGPVTDHFAYVPSIVFCLAASHLVSRLAVVAVPWRAAFVAGVGWCLLLGIATFRHAELWRTGEIWERAAHNAPQTPASLNYANRLVLADRVDEAMSLFRKFYAKSNYSAYVGQTYGSLLASQGMMSEAESVMRETLQRKPGDLQLWFAFGKLLVNAGRPDEAVAALRKALPANPANRIALTGALVRAGRLDEARLEIPLLPEPTRTNVDALADLASDLADVGGFAEAEVILSSILGRFPLAGRARLGLAYVLLDGGKVGEALEQFSQVVAFVPDNAAAIAGLTECLQRQGRADKAALFFQDAVRQHPSPDLLNAYAWFLATCPDATHRDPAKALEQLRTIGDAQLADSPYYQGTLAASLAASGRFAEAVAAAERALALAENSRDRNFIVATRQRLDLYRAGQAYVQPAVTTP